MFLVAEEVVKKLKINKLEKEKKWGEREGGRERERKNGKSSHEMRILFKNTVVSIDLKKK